MNAGTFFQLPAAAQIAILVMFWPAVWAAVLVTVAFAGDLLRQLKKRTSPESRKAA
jgi:hypothetical protein